MKDSKRKKLIFKNASVVTVRGRWLRCLDAEDTFLYLGTTFSAEGLTKIDIAGIVNDLKIVKCSPAKPQQKLFMIRVFLIPRFYHRLIFSRLTAKNLNRIDVSIRKVIREILHLPKDLPKAAFHLRVADGGLGIPPLRFVIPIIARKRLSYSKPNEELFYLDKKRFNTTNQMYNIMRKMLYASWDGAGLSE